MFDLQHELFHLLLTMSMDTITVSRYGTKMYAYAIFGDGSSLRRGGKKKGGPAYRSRPLFDLHGRVQRTHVPPS